MEQQEMDALYEQLTELASAGKEQEAEALLKEQFPRLPKEVQGEILIRMSINEMNKEADRVETAADIQEKGIAIIEAIQALKKS